MNEKIRQQEEVAVALYSNLHKVSQSLKHVDLPLGFTPERLRTLSTIEARGPITITALAEAEQVRPATVSRMVTSLEAEGLIKRRDAREDKRSVLISVTPKGRQICTRANQRYLRYMREAIAELEPEQRRLISELAALLEKLNAAMER